MYSNISSPSVFYVTLKDPEGHVIPDGVNQIAEGLTIIHDENDENDEEGVRWGYVNWFDKLAANMQTLEIQGKPISNGNNYVVKDLNDFSLDFAFVNKKIYDDKIRPLLNLDTPDLDNDEAVQHYLAGLNPYDNN